MPAAHPLPPPPASKCGCGVCPAPQARAKRAPRATRATPAQAFRAPLMRKKRVSPHPPSQAPRSHPPRTTRQRFGEPQLSKLKSESLVPSPNLRFGEGIPRERGTGCPLPAGGLPRRHARWIRQPCVSKASLRRPPPAPKGSVCPVGTCAKRKATRRRAGRKRVPCGHLGRRPKATWRREQIQGMRAVSAQNADICERVNTRAARGQRAERRYLRKAGKRE